jgi:hypothetical protein
MFGTNLPSEAITHVPYLRGGPEMRPFIRDLDDFDIFDSPRARRLYEKQRRKAARYGSGPSTGPRHKHRDEDYEDFEDYEDYEDYQDYQDYNEDEFDSYSRVHHPY